MERPLVSVVVSGFNHEQYIVDALRSIEAQRYPNLEIIFVDGSSTDRTAVLAKEFLAMSRHRVRVVVQANNRGMLKDRALGYSFATGTYVCFFDSDDLMMPHKTAHQVNLLEKTGADAVFGGHDYLGVDGRTTPVRSPVLPTAWNPELFVQNLVLQGWPYAQGGLFRKAVLDRIGGPDQGLPMNDWPFMIRLARTAGQVILEPEPVFLYRRSLASHSRSRSGELLQWKLATFAALLENPLARLAEARAYRGAADFASSHGDAGIAWEWWKQANRRSPQPGRGKFVLQAFLAAFGMRKKGVRRLAVRSVVLRSHPSLATTLAVLEAPFHLLAKLLLDRLVPWLRSIYVSVRYVDEYSVIPSIRFVGRHSRLIIEKEKGARLVIRSILQVKYNHPGRQAASSLKLMAASRMKVDQPFHIGEDVRVLLAPGALLEVGVKGPGSPPISYSGFMGRAIVQIKETCSIGANTGLSWHGEIMDSDWHPVDGRIDAQPIRIGGHVWIAPGTKILKGATIGDDSIIARNSVVLAGTYPASSFIAGAPATVRGPARTWRYEWSAVDKEPPNKPGGS